MSLDPARFDNWFRALNNLGPDQGPFPWQRRLFEKWLCPSNPADARWPRLIKLPTASGKTAIIDLAVLALAVGSPCARRRIAFVVDRRVVVDEAALRARVIAERLRLSLDSPEDPLYGVARALVSMGGEEPLVVATLRGGIPGDDGWARSPAQPAVVLSTVDQVGSRLLFRAYGGHGPRSWPIHAGLLGRDTVVIIDEAHCSAPFCETVRAVVERWQDFAEQRIGEPLALVRMSATPGEEPDFELEPEDRGDEILNRRLRAEKAAELLLVEANRDDYRRRLAEAIVERAHRLLGSMTNGVVGIVVNRVAGARAVFQQLQMDDEHKILLTGRVRGWERDRLLQKWLPRLRTGSREEVAAPIAVVATQCIEVGANLHFDALITEIASLDALRQRFGRLNRLGDRAAAPGVIVAATRQIQSDEAGNAKFPDAVYGQALRRTWVWLNEQAQGDRVCVDFGIDTLEAILPEGEALQRLCQDVCRAYPLLPAHLDLLAQTSPPPEPEPEISAFLHGTTQASPEVTVVWRCDLPLDDPEAWPDRVAAQPPVTGEGCPVPIWEFRRWLAGDHSLPPEDAGDVETVAGGDETAGSARSVLRWRGISEALVAAAGDIVPGDTVVVPSAYGGCDGFGWNPASGESVQDIGDAVAYNAGRRRVLRLEALAALLSSTDAAKPVNLVLDDFTRRAAGDEDAPHVSESLTRLAEIPELPDWLRDLARSLAADRRARLIETAGAYAIVGGRGAGEDLGTADDGASVGAPVSLAGHSIGVRRYAEQFAKATGLPEPLAADVALAGWLHDVGKADPRFQTWLHGGDEVTAALAGAPLAKSAQNPRSRTVIWRARERSRYPLNGRHEVQSLALIAGEKQLRDQAHDWDLVQHLVVSHHGFGRPLVPVVIDSDPVLVTLDHGPLRLAHGSDHLLYRIDSGVAERYWRLVRRYGWWGLAWIEAILRLADHRRSEEEERGEVDDA